MYPKTLYPDPREPGAKHHRLQQTSQGEASGLSDARRDRAYRQLAIAMLGLDVETLTLELRHVPAATSTNLQPAFN
jgi:hypothetical protein